MWFMPSVFVQESASVSDSDSDANCHVVLLLGTFRQMFLVDSFLNGLSSVTSAEPSGFK